MPILALNSSFSIIQRIPAFLLKTERGLIQIIHIFTYIFHTCFIAYLTDVSQLFTYKISQNPLHISIVSGYMIYLMLLNFYLPYFAAVFLIISFPSFSNVRINF